MTSIFILKTFMQKQTNILPSQQTKHKKSPPQPPRHCREHDDIQDWMDNLQPPGRQDPPQTGPVGDTQKHLHHTAAAAPAPSAPTACTTSTSTTIFRRRRVQIPCGSSSSSTGRSHLPCETSLRVLVGGWFRTRARAAFGCRSTAGSREPYANRCSRNFLVLFWHCKCFVCICVLFCLRQPVAGARAEGTPGWGPRGVLWGVLVLQVNHATWLR